ncbi:GntR family transcriptional regulator [Pigmentiphaga kullae]|uniref:GntR family transcriptional regulator n=1 Tax=Pigmentiphaga kullae TaxID=151784 RepID=A0A4Q7NH18_9BURK|nr:GntR family transcriptional regulator [Pigmentiphaga kullae]RZS84098.1 GntR family transcriptional regulator [Pigmentiphaga kullae]
MSIARRVTIFPFEPFLPMPLQAPGPADPVLELLLSRLRLHDTVTTPYYIQLQRQIQALIDGGELRPGHGLPSERVLAQALNLSRTTIKRCYDALRDTQAVASSQGRGGTVVKAAPRVSPAMQRLKGFTEEMRELGLVPSTRVLARAVVQDRMVASIFGRPSNAEFLKLVRVRLADDAPMSREVAWYDLAVAPGLAAWDGKGSAYAHLREHCGIELAWADQSVEAVFSSPEEGEVFGFAQPGPCLLLKRRSHSAQDVLVEYVEGTFRGDAYVYRLKLRS